MKERTTLVIADSHLGARAGDVDQIIRFITKRSPETTELIFLGDLFHVWTGLPKFHTALVKQFLRCLHRFRQAGGVVHLVTGNRDVLFRDKLSATSATALPFDRIATEMLMLSKKGGNLIAVHGDTINSKDRQYLRWRKLIRSRAFRLPFQLIPAKAGKAIMHALEKKLKQTNLEFRHEFPHDEWQSFLAAMSHSHQPALLIAGHFHPDELISSRCEKTIGMVLPDWGDRLFYLTITEELTVTGNIFSEQQSV